MNLPVVVSPAARDDIRQGKRYFVSKRSELGREFIGEVLMTLTKIGDMPFGFGIVSDGVRALGLRRFGYVVYYRTIGDVAEILAVLHGSQPPEVWQARL